MIITCPNCSSRYKVKDGLITEKGKKVKCRKCGAIFIAYKDRDSVLEKAPEAGATTVIQESAGHPGLGTSPPKPPTPPAPPAEQQDPAADGARPSATVKVDRSQLDAFLQQNKPGEEDAASTVQVDPAQFQALREQQEQQEQQPSGVSPQATVQVDRSEIDAFIKKGLDPESEQPPPPPIDPDQPVDSFATQAIPAFDPQAMGLSETPTAPEPSPEVSEQPVDRAPAAEAETEFAGFDTPASFTDEAAPSADPTFPSDEDLGIGDQPPVDQVAETEALPVQQVSSPPEAPVPPAAAAEPEPEPQPAVGETRYKAKVDGNIYPNLTLDSISRWVKEGRLLESDDIALEGTEDFRKAVAYDEIKPFFDQFFGEQSGTKAPAKKGFFARLFSFGK